MMFFFFQVAGWAHVEETTGWWRRGGVVRGEDKLRVGAGGRQIGFFFFFCFLCGKRGRR